MALGATIYKVTLQLADLDRHYYADHALTLARHPSETDERLMVRLLAFALNAHETLEFGRGISTDDEPALWRKDFTGAIQLWIEVGLPEEKSLRKACARAKEVRIYSYGGQAADAWWKQLTRAWQGGQRGRNLRIWNFPVHATQRLVKLARRNMRIQVTIQEGRLLVTDGETALEIAPLSLTLA